MTGAVTLGGRFEIVLGSGYTPAAGQEFELVDAGASLAGTFASITDTALGNALKAEVVVVGKQLRVRIVNR